MSESPVTAEPDLSADVAARLMVNGGFHHLPVTEDGRPLGVLGLRTVVGVVQECPGW